MAIIAISKWVAGWPDRIYACCIFDAGRLALLSKVRKHAPLAVAGLALFFAIGGPSFAADAVSHAARLITGKQIKDSSITTKDVKNGSLLKADFKAGQLPAGAQGAQGARGDTGSQGLKGDTGPPGQDGQDGGQGARGPSDGYISRNNTGGSSMVGTTPGTVGTLSLPAGSYIVTANTRDQNGSTTTDVDMTCTLTVGSSTDVKNFALGHTATDNYALVPLTTGATLAASGSATVSCVQNGGTASTTDSTTQIAAVKVETLTTQP
jgi:hypothetical protein